MKKLILLIPLLCGCGMLKFPVLNAPKPPQTVYNYEQTSKASPQIIQTPDGKAYVWEEKSQRVSAGFDSKEEPLSFWERFCNWLAGWSLITVLVVGGSLAAGFTGPAIWLYNRYITFKNTAKKIVKSIEDSKALQVNQELKSNLSANLDTNEKKVVDDLRRS